MHQAAYRALGLPDTYRAVCVQEDELAWWVERLRRGEVSGINVTVPHKRAAMRLADSIDGPRGRATRATSSRWPRTRA